MSETVSLTQKYRPNVLDDYIGNTIVIKQLKSMFKMRKVPQTILLYGDRGCGKTSLARITAKTLLCEKPMSDGQACNMCNTCVKMTDDFITKGDNLHGLPVYQINISKANTKDEMSQLVDQMSVKGLRNRKRVFILDEVQRATTEAQQTLLKICEEPNPNLYIILATTDIDALIEPLKSRFSLLNIKRPNVKELVHRLEEICIKEQYRYDKTALNLIANHKQRIPREAIISLSNIGIEGDVSYDKTIAELQLISNNIYQKYFELLNKDIFEAMQFIEEIYEVHNIEWSDFLKQLSTYTIDAFNMKLGMRLDKYSEDEYKATKKVLDVFTAKQIGKFLGLIEDALKIKDNPKYALTMLTLKMGFEDYVAPPKETVIIEREIKKEENIAVRSYEENKAKQQVAINEIRKQENVTTTNDIMNMIPNSKVVKLPNTITEKTIDNMSFDT